jgi:mannose-6-phosphate isomerase-like protein (cupin superfamily)
MTYCETITATEPFEPPVAHSSLQEGLMSDVAVTEDQVSVPETHLPIYRLEAELLKLPQVEMPVDHDFCNGLYARTMHIPAGTILTGAVHKDESFFLVRKGHLIVTTDTGTAEVGPGFMSVTPSNTKRAGIAVTDVEVTTFHPNPTNEHDPEVIWNMYTVPAPSHVLEAVGHPHLEIKK